jgi:hypothetical protein
VFDLAVIEPKAVENPFNPVKVVVIRLATKLIPE